MDINDPQFKQESSRLHTFANFPKGDIVAPRELARDGFVYAGQGDRVGCVYCLRNVQDWQRGQDPRLEHESTNPSCPFVRGYDVGNVPIDRPDPRRTRPTLADGYQAQEPVS